MIKLKDFSKYKILIVGLAREGESTFRFLRSLFPDLEIGLADQKKLKDLSPSFINIIKGDRRVHLYLGDEFLLSPEKYEIIIHSPGVPLSLPLFQKARLKDLEITSQAKIFFENTQARIIGVTGTKGKSTTSSLIYHVLKSNHLPVKLVGNIGKPVLSLFSGSFSLGEKGSFYVFELSSHQLADLSASPAIAIFLNLYPDHLDFFSSLENYQQSKLNIARYQKAGDALIYNADDPWLAKNLRKMKAKKFSFSLQDKQRVTCFLSDQWIYYRDKGITERLMALEDIPLIGEFNIDNTMPAIIVGKILGLSSQQIQEAIKTFQALDHHLRRVGTFQGIDFYDDSNATIPEATVQALNALSPRIGTLILGGSEKGLSFDSLAQAILEKKIPILILFPYTGEKIWEAILKHRRGNFLPKHFPAKDMETAIKLSYRWTQPGKICLLSPASASFSIFRNYKERGELFQKWVKKLSS